MLTYTRPNAVELLFSLLTAGTVDRETSSARVEKTGVHYFCDACPVCVCLHGAKWAGPRGLSQQERPPVANHAHRVGHSGVKVNTKPNSTPFFDQDHSRNICFLYFFQKNPLLSCLCDRGLVQWRAVTLITVLQSGPLPNGSGSTISVEMIVMEWFCGISDRFKT